MSTPVVAPMRPALPAVVSRGSVRPEAPSQEPGVSRAAHPVVMKFGGTSLADAECIARSARIVARRMSALGNEEAAPSGQETAPLIVVVSALAGVTNSLEEALAAAAGGEGWEHRIAALGERHRRVLNDLRSLVGGEAAGNPASAPPSPQSSLSGILDELRALLSGVRLVGEATARTRDAVLGAGERISGPIFTTVLNALGIPAEFVDARSVIVTDRRFGDSRPRRSLTADRVGKRLAGSAVAVLPGFVAATEDGQPTTLGRGGSDYTAAIVGSALGAPEIEIWSDVDGVMSADPAKVASARSRREVAYDEVIELAQFGAKVVFEPAIQEARRASATLLIRNTRNPDFPGTRLLEAVQAHAQRTPVGGITSLSGVALIRVGGSVMRADGGANERLLRALQAAGAPPPLLVQIGSGQGVSLAVKCTACSEITDAIEREFELEIAAGRVHRPELCDGLALVAVVGTGLESRPGVCGRMFGALGARGINIRAISQGVSGRSVVFFVDAREETGTVAAVHEALFELERGTHSGSVGASDSDREAL